MKIITFFDFTVFHLTNSFIWFLSLYLVNDMMLNKCIDEYVILIISIIIGTISWLTYYHMQPRVNSKEFNELLSLFDNVDTE